MTNLFEQSHVSHAQLCEPFPTFQVCICVVQSARGKAIQI
jgi:hypothetical protein